MKPVALFAGTTLAATASQQALAFEAGEGRGSQPIASLDLSMEEVARLCENRAGKVHGDAMNCLGVAGDLEGCLGEHSAAFEKRTCEDEMRRSDEDDRPAVTDEEKGTVVCAGRARNAASGAALNARNNLEPMEPARRAARKAAHAECMRVLRNHQASAPAG